MFPVVTILFVLISRSVGSVGQCVKENSVDVSKGTHLSNGDVYYNGVKFARNEYYVDERGTKRGCLCMKQTCLRKCCPFGMGYNFLTKVCEDVIDVFNPPVWDEYSLQRGVNISNLYRFEVGKMNCTSPEVRIRAGGAFPDNKHHHRLRLNGQLYIELPNTIPPWTVVGPDKYCIDTFVYDDGDGHKTTKIDALVCFAEAAFDFTNYIVSSACMLVSCVFILATVAVYAWLPELRNLHGRVLMAYLLCLFVGFLFLATMQILLIINNITVVYCLTFTFIIYFFLLSAFFWLNVMCFDIWWTFSGNRGQSLEKLSMRARFCAYAVYAFGVPTLLTLTMAGLEFSGLPLHPLMPNLKHHGCFIYGTSKVLYLYGPILVLCVANMVFFVLTALKITQIKQQTSVLKSKESAMHDQHRNDKQRLLLYVKLFAVMGISWILEVVSGIYPDLPLWRYTDAYNVLIGVIIFIIFVCKRKIFRLMKKRIEERFHRRSSSLGDMRQLSYRGRMKWRLYQTQRASVDTIKSTLTFDIPDSNKITQ